MSNEAPYVDLDYLVSRIEAVRSGAIALKDSTFPPIHAAMHADAMLGRGDMDGQRAWLRILKAIDALLDTRPSNGAAASAA